LALPCSAMAKACRSSEKIPKKSKSNYQAGVQLDKKQRLQCYDTRDSSEVPAAGATRGKGKKKTVAPGARAMFEHGKGQKVRECSLAAEAGAFWAPPPKRMDKKRHHFSGSFSGRDCSRAERDKLKKKKRRTNKDVSLETIW